MTISQQADDVGRALAGERQCINCLKWVSKNLEGQICILCLADYLNGEFEKLDKAYVAAFGGTSIRRGWSAGGLDEVS